MAFGLRGILLGILLGGCTKAQWTPRGAVTATQIIVPASNDLSPSLTFGDSDATCLKLLPREDGLTILSANTVSLAEFKKTDNGASLQVPSLEVHDTLIIKGDVLVNGIKQWKLVHHETFKVGEAPTGWDNDSADVVTNCAGIHMLGGYGKFAEGEASRSIDNLPEHAAVRINAVFHFIDNWTGESGFMRLDAGVDGSLVHVWTDSHKVNSAAGINVCGAKTPETKFAVPIDVSLPHSRASLQVAFGSTMKSDIPQEASWGISLLDIYVK